MRSQATHQQLGVIRNIIVSTIVLLLISEAIPPVFARNVATTYTTILNGNHTEFLYWTLDNKDDEHILNCTLPEGVEQPDVFEWKFPDYDSENNSTLNTTNYVDDDDRSIFIKFDNITYAIVGTYQCRSIFWDEYENKTNTNITRVFIYVQENRMLELLIGMSVAAVVFFIISMILIKYL